MTKQEAIAAKAFPSCYVLIEKLMVPTDPNYLDYDLTNKIDLVDMEEKNNDDQEDDNEDLSDESSDDEDKDHTKVMKSIQDLDKGMKKNLPDVLKTKIF
jgi:hypothetical protein